jgi:GTP cyclohydrolase IA
MVTKEQALEAVKTLIKWAGDDPNRKELLETPERVVKSYQEFFKGYNMTLDKVTKTFDKAKHYDDMILLKNIRIESYCEHHMVPIIGKAAVAYIPGDKIIGLSKIARVVEIYARRLQIQERLTVEIAEGLNTMLNPLGVGVVIEAAHQCLTTRGAHKPGSIMRTTHMIGVFKDKDIRREFFGSIQTKR